MTKVTDGFGVGVAVGTGVQVAVGTAVGTGVQVAVDVTVGVDDSDGSGVTVGPVASVGDTATLTCNIGVGDKTGSTDVFCPQAERKTVKPSNKIVSISFFMLSYHFLCTAGQ